MIIDSWMAERLSFSWLKYAFPDLPFPVLSSGTMLTAAQQVKEYIEDPRRMLLG